MAQIQFLPVAAKSNSYPKITAPVVVQSELTISAPDGATPLDLLAAIASGSAASFAGQIINEGCHALEAVITYLDGDDCDACTTPDTLVPAAVTVKIPKNSAFPVPEGFIVGITVVTLDAAGVPAAVQTDQKVSYYACYQPCCGGAVLVP